MGSAMHTQAQKAPLNYDVSAKAVICRHAQVLLLRRPNGRWDLPGGRARPGEAITDALRREVREETGLRLGAVDQLSVIHRKRASGRDCLVASFHCLFDQRLTEDMIALSGEHEAFAFVAFSQTEGLRLRAHHKKAIADTWQLMGLAEAA